MATVNSSPAWASPINPDPVINTIEQHEQELFSPFSTLDEPVIDTIMRDVHAVATKLKVVMKPLDRSTVLLTSASYAVLSQTPAPEEPELTDNDRMVLKELKDWDLWGPLVLCLTLSVILSFKAPPNQASLVFAAVFCAIWVGSTIVTINAQLLGSTISFFQSLCVLGYSIFPLTLSAFIVGFLRLFFNTWLLIDCIIIFIGYVWAIRTSSVFMSLYIKSERRFLALYPVIFFYMFMSWMILLF
jgi:protein YIPF6